MKSTAIKIVSGVLVVAIIVVAALAIAGVFSAKTPNEVAVAEPDAAVNEQHMFRNFGTDTVLYIRSLDGKEISGSVDKYIYVVDNEYNKVSMAWAYDQVDSDGNVGIKPVVGWKEGMFYSVSLAAGYEFVNEQYKGFDSFMCIVDARESTEADTKVKDGVIMLQDGEFYIPELQEDFSTRLDYYTLTVNGACPEGDLVFVYENGTKSRAFRKAVDAGQVVDNGDSYTLTVEDADVSDVYEYIYVKKSYDVEEGDIEFLEDETIASLRSSDWYLAAVQYLYGEDLDAVSKEEGKWITVKFDPSFTPGTPSVVKLNLTITFNGLWKKSDGTRDTNGKIIIKIANTLTPVFDVHIQDNDAGKSFDVSLDLDIETTATIEATYANSWSSLDEKDNKLKDIANGLASLVSKYCSEKLGNGGDSAKPYTFAKWMIPIGTLPICIEDTLGFELGASFAGEVGVVATNKFHATFGVVYAGGDLQSYHNVDDTFHLDNITLAGTAGAKFGLFNEVGISAYGTISVDLGIHAGVYADLAGRLSLSGDDIIKLFKNEKSINIIPAYYFETGVYVDLDAAGKIFGFTLKKFNLLNKKFPLYSAGHKYLPMSFVEEKVEDTMYMQSSYFYVIGWDVEALDIQALGSAASERNLAWSEFDYTLGDNLRMDGNVIYATTVDEFESYIIVTSKVNKGLSKKITVIKNPEAPTTTNAVQVYDVAEPDDVNWNVMLNSSKLIGVSLDGKALFDTEYSAGSNMLTIKKAKIAKLGYGTHNVLVESSKGYLQLVVRVINSADIEVVNTTETFDKGAAKATTWSMKLQGNEIVSVVDGATAISANLYNYRESTNQFVILPSYWAGKAVGGYTVIVTCSNGDEFELGVEVEDSRKAKLNTVEYEYVYGSKASLNLDVTLYEDTVSSVSLENEIYPTDVAAVPYELLADKAVGGIYEGTISTAKGEPQAFRVKVVATSESLIIPVKSKVFNKSSNEDIVFAAKIPSGAKVDLIGAAADAYEVGRESITIKAAYLKKQNGTEWTGTVSAGGNSVKLTIALVNDLMPSLDKVAFESADANAIEVKWNLQGVAVEDVVIEGLTAEQYAKSSDRLTIYPADLGYGANVVTIYTAKNTLSLTINRKGTPSIAGNVTVNKKNAEVAKYSLDVAHVGFSYVEVDGATILASAYRYNEGSLILANEFVYNLAVGTYNVHVYLTDGTKLDTTLTVNGDISSATSIGRGTPAEPYLIYTAEQMMSIDATQSYKLMADIDMYGKTMSPIGDKDHPYSGTFNGNGYTISNLTITEPVKYDKDGYAIGLFGVVGSKGSVKGLRLNGAKVSFAKSGSVSAGIVAGRNYGTIEDVTIANGSISAESKSWLDIKNAYFDLGAVVGCNDGGILANISVEANISGKVKGLNVLGIQIGGRKSLINAGAVVGYFTTAEENIVNRLVKNIQVTASISCDADNNSVTSNGWYGYSDLSADKIAACIKRVNVISK